VSRFASRADSEGFQRFFALPASSGVKAPLLVYQIFSNQKLVLHNKGMCEVKLRRSSVDAIYCFANVIQSR